MRTLTPLLTPSTLAGAWTAAHLASDVVRRWRPSTHEAGRFGPLTARAFGRGSDTLLLLHGLGATGDYWPRTYDAAGATRRVIIPDLLGFGRSIYEARPSFSLGNHLDALDDCLKLAAPTMGRISIVAHSMGSGLAVALASRLGDRLDRLVCIGAPMFADRVQAKQSIAGQGLMARLFLLDPVWAECFCGLSCRHRTAAGWLAAVAAPTFPLPISRAASLHTWPAYRDSLASLVLDFNWADALASLPDRPATLVWGSGDPIGDPGLALRLAAAAETPATIRVVSVPGARHHLPITHPDEVLGRL